MKIKIIGISNVRCEVHIIRMGLTTNLYRRIQKYAQQCHRCLHEITVILTYITDQPQITGHFFSNYYWPALRHNLAISSMTRKHIIPYEATNSSWNTYL